MFESSWRLAQQIISTLITKYGKFTNFYIRIDLLIIYIYGFIKISFLDLYLKVQ